MIDLLEILTGLVLLVWAAAEVSPILAKAVAGAILLATGTLGYMRK